MATLKEKIDFALVLPLKTQTRMGIPWMEIARELHTMGWEKCQMFA